MTDKSQFAAPSESGAASGDDPYPGSEPSVASAGKGSRFRQDRSDPALGQTLDPESLAILRRFFEMLDEWDRGRNGHQ